jgi:uncharacterized membrane protein YdjX (TVP38/TMEM64 family)
MPQRSHTVSRSKVFLRRLEAAAIFAASFALAVFVVAEKPDVEHLLGVLGPLALPLATAIFAVVAAAPFSVTDALAIMNGVLFGPLWGSVVSALGIVLASVIGYLIALRTSRLLEIEASVARLPSWARHFRIGSPAFLIVLRIIPGTLATQTAAALRVPLLRQIYTMSVIAIPICTVLAVGGNAVSSYIDTHVFEPAAALAAKHHVHLLHRSHHSATPTPQPHFDDP